VVIMLKITVLFVEVEWIIREISLVYYGLLPVNISVFCFN